ncbi:MAG TPA: DUF885 domain-containing protein [Dongiaceae bacterium]|nr:DUF885 domain-containing protein [Dongiaceae bacterium]
MKKTEKQFEGLLSRYFEGLLEAVPTLAAMNGLRWAEGNLGALSPAFHKQRERERQSALQALEQISPRELTNEQQFDRLALRSLLLKESEDYARGRPGLEPNAPEHLMNILLYELQRGDDEPQRAARNLRALLKAAPGFVGAALPAVRKPERVWRGVMEQTVAGGATLLAGAAKFLESAGPLPDDASLLEAVKRALEGYRDRVRGRDCAAAGSFAVGAAVLQRRVRDELGLDFTLGQVEAAALGEVERVGGLLKAACARFGRRRRPDEIIAQARVAWRPGKPLLGLYREETRRIAEGFRQAQAVTFPTGDELQVKPVPEFLRTLIPTAAYSQPAAFAKRQRGIFWVNDLSVTKSTEAEKLAEQQQHFGLALTCAHEAYPGHHLQFVTANRHPRKWRRLFAHAVFYEGWTLWCEQMMVDLRIDDSPWLRVQQLHDALWRCHRILVDLRLQTGRYSYDRGVRHLQRHLGFTRARAEADVNWYTAQPAVPMSYWLGRLENERLQRRLMAGRGWSLQRFNDWLLSFGTLPQAWIEKYGLE